MSKRILIIEDDERIAHWISTYLERSGFQTTIRHDGQSGLHIAQTEQPDLIILDIMLPGLDGFSICQRIRHQNDTPIIMLTAKDQVSDKIQGLNVGADDYLTKPFDTDELIARVKAVLRRSHQEVQKGLSCKPFTINLQEESVYLDEEKLTLPHTQFELLKVFVAHPNRVFSRDQLIQKAFGKEFNGYDRSIDNHISRLRKNVNHQGKQFIQTIYGSGYKFVANPT